ncbi:hypothetical protein [Rhizobium terrae]|uniref:hypothetical protein n=1 Tax=Rhizobium terrae TaxID=2171756 RepID=UPI000E3EDB65|nr:hypothetical protein [Rhizobium terrae]
MSQAFDNEMERIGGALKAMREACSAAAAMLHNVARELDLPQEALLDAEEKRLQAEMPERQAIEAAMARLVEGVAAETGTRKAQFDNRELPTRGERLIGFISKTAMRRRQQARWRDGAALRKIEELLRRADRLIGLASEERALLVVERKESENDLVAFIDHRPEVVQKLCGENGEAMKGVEATRRMGRAVAIFQTFVDALNVRVATCNILLHKLTADAEDLLILYQVVAEAGRHDRSLKADDFPNLSSEITRFANGMLTIHGLDRRRQRADQAFAERFPAEVATGSTVEVEPIKGRFRLPPGSGFGVRTVLKEASDRLGL